MSNPMSLTNSDRVSNETNDDIHRPFIRRVIEWSRDIRGLHTDVRPEFKLTESEPNLYDFEGYEVANVRTAPLSYGSFVALCIAIVAFGLAEGTGPSTLSTALNGTGAVSFLLGAVGLCIAYVVWRRARTAITVAIHTGTEPLSMARVRAFETRFARTTPWIVSRSVEPDVTSTDTVRVFVANGTGFEERLGQSSAVPAHRVALEHAATR